MSECLTRAEHEEFRRAIEEQSKRHDDHNHRQDARIRELEESVKQLSALHTSVEKLADSMGRMYEEQKKQGDRLEALEQKPARRMSAIGTTAQTALITCLISSFVTWLITFIATG